MFNVYIYALDTSADWELGHVTAELYSGRFFKEDAPQVLLQTVGLSKAPSGHTSNGPEFLELFAPGYGGQAFYVDQPSVADHNLITASCTGSLLWAKQIIEHLGVFGADTLEAWYQYFSTGKPEHFYALMQSLPFANSEP